ncbi:hypothetical protein QYE76_063598 [Lolium multiflorum]|uniref:Reverse transcriptase domain-containing protein n=1 Tax=Lolium multiflorum TaxID=4521 RepID=A0AAD8S6S9_LOLMU|nr:hypothetical protein QYE76_063598 [Lolium multiflorum]
MENYSSSWEQVMKMAVEMAAVSMEKPSGGTSPLRRRAEQLCPPDLGSRWRRLEGSFTRNKEEFKWDLLDRIQGNTEGWENDKGRESGKCIEAKTIDSILPEAYIEKTPFPVKMKEYSVITSVVNKSVKKPIEPEEQINVEPAIAIVKDLVTENVEDGHIIFCEDASHIVSHPSKSRKASVPMLSVRIGDHCYYGLCDIGASISAIPYELYTEIMHEIGSCELEDIDVVIRLDNRETISPIGIVRDVEVLCDCKKEKIVTKFAGESYEFNFSKFAKVHYKAKLPNNDFRVEQLASIDLAPNNPLQQHLEDHESEVFREERNELDEIFLRQPILKHDLPVEDLGTTPPPKEDPVFDLKPLPDNLKYAYIDDKKTYHVIISAKLSDFEEERLLEILKKHRGAIGYTLDDLKGISPAICQHAINMEDDAKPVVEHQRRLIPKMKDVVRNEVLKLLEAGIIYPIADSRWVSPVHCVPKKGGITVVPNDNDELIPQRVVVGYRMCIDFRKVNKVNKKDHYPLPFIDQMLERLSKNTHFCFLDGYSGFSQIAVRVKDQEKTTFTCPYGTYAYRRMPFGLCNAPATFQRCMSAIFHGFCEKIVEVFMDDFSVYENSFDNCLRNLDKVLQRCEETNLVLNWEKCHFMVNEGIVLGHKISERGIEVDRAKVEAIEKMPYPRDVKDRKGADNLVADNLSRLENIAYDPVPVNDSFPNEQLAVRKIEDVRGPKGEGSLEDRMEKLEQEVFAYKKMAEREVDIFHRIVSELIDEHKKETTKLWDDILSLHNTTNQLQAQLYDVQNQNYQTQIATAVTVCCGRDGGDDGGDDGDGDGDDVQLDDGDDGVDLPLREGISPADSCPPESSFLSGVLRPAEAAVTLARYPLWLRFSDEGFREEKEAKGAVGPPHHMVARPPWAAPPMVWATLGPSAPPSGFLRYLEK